MVEEDSDQILGFSLAYDVVWYIHVMKTHNTMTHVYRNYPNGLVLGAVPNGDLIGPLTIGADVTGSERDPSNGGPPCTSTFSPGSSRIE
jgi:hypothetical protein